jgi:uncharacterized membrane protein
VPKFTQADADQIKAKAAAAFGDLVPISGPAPTAETLDQIVAVHAILMGMSKSALAGALASALLQTYGKGTPVIARRMVEVYGAVEADGLG